MKNAMKRTIPLLAALALGHMGCTSGSGDTCKQLDIWEYEAGQCETSLWCLDLDGDGAGGDALCQTSCEPPAVNWAAGGGDCDDAVASILPEGAELCNGLDDDCDGRVDEDALGVREWYEDSDGDGHGVAESAAQSCAQPEGYSPVGDDCAPTDASIHPGISETPDGRDQDCDGWVDEGLASADYDGDGLALDAGDCDDTDAEVRPGLDEVCDGKDNDCDGLTDDADDGLLGAPTWSEDNDGDGSPSGAGEAIIACNSPGDGYATGEADCDDSDAERSPLNAEAWGNDVDEDCDGAAPSADAYVSPTGAWVASDASGETFTTIGDALDAAVVGQTIAVEPGTYHETVNFGGVDVVLISMTGPDNTIIDPAGTQSAALFTNGETSDARLEGFTLTGGGGTDGSLCGFSPGIRYGGGVCIRSSSPTLVGNRIIGNGVNGSGGGVYVEYGHPSLLHNLIADNTALFDGGGLNLSHSMATLSQNQVLRNAVGRSGGGAVINASELTLSYERYEGNHAEGHITPPAAIEGPLGGGAIIVTSGSIVTLSHVIVVGNSAQTHGGGVQLYTDPRAIDGAPSTVTIDHSVLALNSAVGEGGGLGVWGGSVHLSASILHHNSAEAGGANAFVEDATLESGSNLFFVEGGGDGLSGATLAQGDINAPAKLLAADASPADVHLSADSPAVDALEGADAHGGLEDLGAYGGQGGGAWDSDGDGLPAHSWPGLAQEAPDGVDASQWDCDDFMPDVGACSQ